MKTNRLLMFVSIFILITLIVCGCSKNDKFVGVWYKNGVKDGEITKENDKYFYQTYIDGTEKGVLYEDGFISEEGYLLFDAKGGSRFYGFEYKNKNEILDLILWKPESDSKPDECKREDNYILTRESSSEE